MKLTKLIALLLPFALLSADAQALRIGGFVFPSTDLTNGWMQSNGSGTLSLTKDFDWGTASNSSRVTLPKASTATLSGLTRKQGTLAFDTTQGKPVYDDGSSLFTLSTSSLTAPAVTPLTATGTQTGWLFTISTSSTVAVGDTYKENNGAGNTYTVLGALTAQTGQVLFMSGSSSAATTPLVRQTGSGTSSIAFTAETAIATYLTPTSPSPLYLRVKMAGGGGGGSGAGPAGGNAGTSGTATFFGPNLLIAGGGAGAAAGGIGGAGGTVTVNSPAAGMAYAGGSGQGSFVAASATVDASGGMGGGNCLSGGGGGGQGASTNGVAGATSSGAGGGGGGGVANGYGGGGGGAGGCMNGIIIPSPSASYVYAIGTNGTGGTHITSGSDGANGGSGSLEITALYQ